MPDYEDEALLRELYERGLSQKEIASEIGCSQPTVSNKMREFGIGGSTCHTCGNTYESLGIHWLTTCEAPELTDRQHEIITGLLMGDGSVWSPGSGCFLEITNTKIEFLEWIDTELDPITSGIRLKSTAEESATRTAELNGSDDVNTETHSDVYRISTYSHPELDQYREWYESGEKVYPDIDLTPLIASCWYCCDGSLAGAKDAEGRYRNVFFSSLNESDDYQKLIDMFADAGFEVSGASPPNIWFDKHESGRLLEWMEGPLPGFEYKWNHSLIDS